MISDHEDNQFQYQHCDINTKSYIKTYQLYQHDEWRTNLQPTLLPSMVISTLSMPSLCTSATSKLHLDFNFQIVCKLVHWGTKQRRICIQIIKQLSSVSYNLNHFIYFNYCEQELISYFLISLSIFPVSKNFPLFI